MIGINDNGKQKTLMVDDFPQSAYPPPKGGYWEMMIPTKVPKTALILGAGGGTIPRILLEKFPEDCLSLENCLLP